MPADRAILMRGSTRGAFSIALLAIVAAAMYNWVLWPHVGYLRAVQRYQPIVDEMARQTGMISKTLDRKRQQLRAMQGELAGIHESLFTLAEAKAFLGSLQSFVEQTGCKVITADFTSPTDDRPGQTRESKERAPAIASHVDLTVTGLYDQIISLLGRLQTNPKKVWVDSCGMRRSEPRSGRLECRLSLTLYAQSEKEGSIDE